MILINKNMPLEAFRILEKAAARLMTVRSVPMEEGLSVSLEIDTSLSDERYVIKSGNVGCKLRAADGLALFAALGRFFRLSHFDGKGGFLPFEGEIDFTPAKKLRGMYFATHFNNFYHSAPIEKVCEVVEDLALRGCNSLLVWFDMHHFESMEDAGAQTLVKRLREILGYANRIGIGGSLTMISNEGFASSPKELRAEWQARNGYHAEPDSHYHVEICPSKAGGIEEILRARRAMLEYFADLKIDYVVYWPYDQGGCTCKDCAPWGANGFLKLLPHFKALVKEMMPQTEVIVSAWYFDRFTSGEWAGFTERLGDEMFADVPYILSFFANGELPPVLQERGMPAGVKFIEFPEISMWSCSPWGGYGASHLAEFLERNHGTGKSIYSGAYPYSEGIFEDANKFIELALYSGEYENAFDALRDYVRFEFCTDDEELYEALRLTESSLSRKRSRPGDYIKVTMNDTSEVEHVREVFEKYNSILPENITSSRNFRLFYLRALIDSEIARNDGFSIRSELCQKAMQEIDEIYYVNEKTCPWVRPATGK
ncbi:MAG: hypothetical protein IJB43_09905 [Clostridia bacterium]|nr:hypothetical protein [Clostridia bacterium]